MINNQWYAITSSAPVKPGKLAGLRRFGRNLVLDRNRARELGCAAVLRAHRRASLAKGCVSDGNIKCPFHGIEYDTNGKCVYIPFEGRSSEADLSRFNLKSYETREIGGIVFVWYGDGIPDHEPDCFDIITDSSYVYDEIIDKWAVHYSRVIENQLDVSHLAFVHKTTIGRGNKCLVNGPRVVWIDDDRYG